MTRELWSSRYGFLMAVIGSAVGLGNVWMFPYRCARCGGAAFLIPYFIILLFVGIVGLTVEWAIGRSQRAGPIDAFIKSGMPGGKYLGWIPIINVFLIFSFYAVIEGWCIKYMVISFSGAIMDIDPGSYFGEFTSSYEPLIWLALGIGATITINSFGVRKGIERSCRLFVPILIGLIAILMIWSLSLPGAREGIEFFTKPDFSKLTWDVWLNAMGQVFFSLSLVGSCMMVYGSYMRSDGDIPGGAIITAVGNTAISIMFGLMIFPAIFALSQNPAELIQGGPPLAFIALTQIFGEMPGGQIFASAFFTLLFIAALSSDVSMLEPVTDVCIDRFGMGRRKAVVLLGLLAFLVAIPCALLPWFLDFVASTLTTMILAPIGGILAAIALGWFIGVKRARKEVETGSRIRVPLWGSYVKYIYPVIIGVIFVLGLLSIFGIFEATW